MKVIKGNGLKAEVEKALTQTPSQARADAFKKKMARDYREYQFRKGMGDEKADEIYDKAMYENMEIMLSHLEEHLALGGQSVFVWESEDHEDSDV